MQAVKERDDYIIGKPFEPVAGHDSEEEKGFQKGLAAENKLIRRRSEESL